MSFLIGNEIVATVFHLNGSEIWATKILNVLIMDFNLFKFEHHTFYTKQTEDINKAIIYDQYMKPFFFL